MEWLFSDLTENDNQIGYSEYLERVHKSLSFIFNGEPSLSESASCRAT